jgi:hypothetical protein
MTTKVRDALVSATVGTMVPLFVTELKQRGGPAPSDFDRARAFAPVLAERADTMMYGGKRGEAAKLMSDMCFAIAVLSFCPGGINIFGNQFENH